jgi:hypothetical protein
MRNGILTATIVLFLAMTADQARGQVALRDRIDQAIEGARGGRVAPPADDAEFLRRASLDLTGTIPTADQARAFLEDTNPAKREAFIDRVLGSLDFARRMQVVFDVMLMERRPAANVPAAEWEAFLFNAFADNRPLDVVAREILAADGSDLEHRGPSRFFLDREGEPNLLTRDVGRMFLGRDMQCAQCHDHVLYDDYKQADYYGLFAFFNRTYLVKDAAGLATLGEKADGDVTFKSVFKKKVTHTTGPHILDAEPLVEPAALPKGEEYWAAPSDKIRAIPRFSRRSQLAAALASKEVPEFNRNLANRLWAVVMGRGIVHPLDLHTDANPPTHPELLDMLAGELAAMNYDARAFIRELVLTRTYARSSIPSPSLTTDDTADGEYAVAMLKPLGPEQLAWSLMQAAGILASTRANIHQRFYDSDPRFVQLTQADDKRRELGERMEATAFYEQMKSNSGTFLTLFSRAPGQSQDGFDASVHQALFLSNSQLVQSWIESLANRAATNGDDNGVIDELYLSMLTRFPDPEERAEAAGYVASRKDARKAAIAELAWALLTSTEFRFNH